MNRDLKIGIIGIGTVGGTLAQALTQSGYSVIALSSRRYNSALKVSTLIEGCRAYHTPQQVSDVADIIFITTPDGVIKETAENIDWRQGQFVVHCSGADTAHLLEKASSDGAQCGVFHPLQTLAFQDQALINLKGATFTIEAKGSLLEILKDMTSSLGGNPLELKAEDKVLYHTSAVIASNYLVTLLSLSLKLWQNFGKSEKEALQALLPLVKGTVNNIEKIGLPRCLTGPICRGDTDTISKHLATLSETAADILPLYCLLGQETLPLARAKGSLSKKKMIELEELLIND